MEKNKITLVPKIGTIFYDETIDNTVILSKVTNELNRPPILTFCTLQNPNAIERFCYSFDMSSGNESRLRRLYVNGFSKSLIPQEHNYRYLFRGASCSDEAIKNFPREVSTKHIFDTDIIRKLTIHEYFLLSAALTSHKMTLNKRTNEIV